MFRIFGAAIAVCSLIAMPVFAQVQPQSTETITPADAGALLNVITTLERGDCKGVPPPRSPSEKDTRTCEPYKLGAVYGPLAVDVGHLQEVVKAFQTADQDLHREIFGAAPTAPDEKESASDKAARVKKNADFAEKQQKLLDQPHPITLMHFTFADLNVGDPPKNPVLPDVLAGLAKIMDGPFTAPPDKPAPPAAAATEPRTPKS
jgi:hypothetical protein